MDSIIPKIDIADLQPYLILFGLGYSILWVFDIKNFRKLNIANQIINSVLLSISLFAAAVFLSLCGLTFFLDNWNNTVSAVIGILLLYFYVFDPIVTKISKKGKKK